MEALLIPSADKLDLPSDQLELWLQAAVQAELVRGHQGA
jgi:hypothetical protein